MTYNECDKVSKNSLLVPLYIPAKIFRSLFKIVSDMELW
jgi:hypothetical protein